MSSCSACGKVDSAKISEFHNLWLNAIISVAWERCPLLNGLCIKFLPILYRGKNSQMTQHRSQLVYFQIPRNSIIFLWVVIQYNLYNCICKSSSCSEKSQIFQLLSFILHQLSWTSWLISNIFNAENKWDSRVDRKMRFPMLGMLDNGI